MPRPYKCIYFSLNSNSLAMKENWDNTDHHRRMFLSRIRLGVRWPRCPRTWRCWWCSGECRSGPCSPASTRRGTTSGRVSRRRVHVSCHFATAPRTNYHWNILFWCYWFCSTLTVYWVDGAVALSYLPVYIRFHLCHLLWMSLLLKKQRRRKVR